MDSFIHICMVQISHKLKMHAACTFGEHKCINHTQNFAIFNMQRQMSACAVKIYDSWLLNIMRVLHNTDMQSMVCIN